MTKRHDILEMKINAIYHPILINIKQNETRSWIFIWIYYNLLSLDLAMILDTSFIVIVIKLRLILRNWTDDAKQQGGLRARY